MQNYRKWIKIILISLVLPSPGSIVVIVVRWWTWFRWTSTDSVMIPFFVDDSVYEISSSFKALIEWFFYYFWTYHVGEDTAFNLYNNTRIYWKHIRKMVIAKGGYSLLTYWKGRTFLIRFDLFYSVNLLEELTSMLYSDKDICPFNFTFFELCCIWSWFLDLLLWTTIGDGFFDITDRVRIN